MSKFLSLLILPMLFVGMHAAEAAYPKASRDDVKQMVVDEARANGVVPPALALAVARVESNFNPRAISSAGARGVMQIMPATARSEFGVHKDRLWEPRLNIRLGVTYLERLYRQYGNRWELALSHYNGGTLKGRGAHARPHDYTRGYVRQVRKWHAKFDREETKDALRQVASVERVSPARPVEPETHYWLSEEPYVERDWRGYLKIAENYTAPKAAEAYPLPEDAAHVQDNGNARGNGDWQPVGGHGNAMLDNFFGKIETVRSRFRSHLQSKKYL